MKTLTPKREARLEKKKKKIAALAEIVKLNDNDRTAVIKDKECNRGLLEKLNKKSDSAESSSEPESKRIKLASNNMVKHSNVIGDSQESDSDMNMKCNLNLTKEQYLQLKRELNERKKLIRYVPKLHFRDFGELANLTVDTENRTPIFLMDIQHLLMSVLIGSGSPCTPSRWCYLEKSTKLSHTNVLIVEGLSLFHFLSNETQFLETGKIFGTKLEIVLPPCRENSILQNLMIVPLTNSQRQDLIAKYGSLEAAIELNKDPTLIAETIFPIQKKEEKNKEEELSQPGDKFPRTKLLLSALQMVDEGYPLPLRGELEKRYKDYILTKDIYEKVTPNSPLFGLDCEMCRTTAGFNELTRISIVDENLKTVYETLVRPTNKIIDYLTKYSGITPEMMLSVTKTLQQVQEEVRSLLPSDAILVGQSLNADLHAMKMMHPYVIDTSVIFNITGERRRKTKLQTLVKTFLDEDIQENIDGHDSVEDSQASLKLVKLKLSNGVDFGDVILCGKKRANEIQNEKLEEKLANNLFAHVSKRDKRTAIVTSQNMTESLKKIVDTSKNTENENSAINWFEVDGNKAAIRKTQEISLENALTITNLKIDSEKLELEKIEKTITKIDKWIAKLWERVAHNGLFIVLFGGAPGSPSGVVMIKIKKNLNEAISETSITV